jgi:hypothetical protein
VRIVGRRHERCSKIVVAQRQLVPNIEIDGDNDTKNSQCIWLSTIDNSRSKSRKLK